MSTPDLNPEVRASGGFGTIGRYRLQRRLGAGGFAVVWLARDPSLDAFVAIKIMAENWASRNDLRERFLREAQLLRQASSRRVVQVFDIGELPDGRPYFVMEFADRGTLDDRIQAAPIALDEALRTTAEVAEGVADLHDAGVVHRDVKPSNVLIASDRSGGERLVLADLGVAKSLAQASRLTMSVGSAGYQAPEQAEPNTDVDVRADVYSLGALGYRLVTGSTPAAPGKVLPPSHFRADLPPAVSAALMSALAPARDDRPATARTFASTLLKLIGDDVSPVPPPVTSPPAAHHPAPPPPDLPPGGSSSPTSSDLPPGSGGPPPAPTSPGRAHDSAGLLPGEPERESPFPREASSRRPRRRWLRGPAALVVLALAGAGGGLGYLHERDGRWPWESSPTATVRDVTGRIEVRVPRAWAVEAVPGGWNPASIGLPAGNQPAVLVADRVNAWNDLTQDVDGVFAAFEDDTDLAAAVGAIRHSNCGDAGNSAYDGARWKGEIRRWDDCDGGTRSVEEVLLTPVGASAPRMYVQIRQSGDPDRTTQVLDGLQLLD